jgi:hypothetical protein
MQIPDKNCLLTIDYYIYVMKYKFDEELLLDVKYFLCDLVIIFTCFRKISPSHDGHLFSSELINDVTGGWQANG